MSIDINAAFENVFRSSSSSYSSSSSSKREGSYPYPTFELTRKNNRGKVFGVLIPDSKNIPLRIIKNVCTTWLTYTDEEGNDRGGEFKWCDSSNFGGRLSEEDNALLTRVKEELDKYAVNYDGEWSPVKVSSKVTIFYFAITKTVSDESGDIQKYNNPGTTVMIHRAAAFPESFSSAMKAKSEGLDDTSWIRDYFNRNEGIHNKVTSIITSLKGNQPGYNIGFTFDELNNLAATIDESHLTAASDLNNEYINVNEFDRKYFEKMLKILEDKNAASDSANNVVSTPMPEPTIKDPDLVKSPEPKVSVGLEDLD